MTWAGTLGFVLRLLGRVVVLIAALAAALLLLLWLAFPGHGKEEAALRRQVSIDLQQLGMALDDYHQDHGVWPEDWHQVDLVQQKEVPPKMLARMEQDLELVRRPGRDRPLLISRPLPGLPAGYSGSIGDEGLAEDQSDYRIINDATGQHFVPLAEVEAFLSDAAIARRMLEQDLAALASAVTSFERQKHRYPTGLAELAAEGQDDEDRALAARYQDRIRWVASGQTQPILVTAAMGDPPVHLVIDGVRPEEVPAERLEAHLAEALERAVRSQAAVEKWRRRTGAR